ncbi:MAG TPA: sodium:proton antiporter [Ignavibacteria bacterium]|nr:sodium:proton antiporter [Ignavibacteria bacterium]HMR40278.1 sodium:proton antiporter [Ignavibacteria bacterium]
MLGVFHIISILVVISAGFAIINFRYLKYPATIGLMIVSLVFSTIIIILDQFFPGMENLLSKELLTLNFSELLLEGMLSFMLFAGAIHVSFDDLKSEKLTIILFSTLSVIISTILIGYISYYVLKVIGINVSILHTFLFGALISPTDPIAVMSILKTAKISKSLETKIAGESLFNDGVAVVTFLAILKMSKPGAEVDAVTILRLFGQEAFGGILLGIILGIIGFNLIKHIQNYKIVVMITLAIVMGGYTIADLTNVSGPLAMVIAGVITGNKSKKYGMTEETREYVDKFWELIDDILNAILFVLMGMQLLLIDFNLVVLITAFIAVFICLFSRYISVWVPSLLIRYKEKISQKTLFILTWGGLRGGISIALALSILPEYNRELLVTITYVVVCFTVLVQGLTIGKLAKKMS